MNSTLKNRQWPTTLHQFLVMQSEKLMHKKSALKPQEY